MAGIYTIASATVVIMPQKGVLALRKTQDRDHKDCPHLIFSAGEATALWETLKGAGMPIAGTSLSLYGEGMNEAGDYNEAIAAAVCQPATSKTGRAYLKAIEWSPEQLRAFNPRTVQLEYGVFGGPALCAYLTQPFKRGNSAAARIIPDITRIDPASPQGKEIAARNTPTTQTIKRGGK